MLPRRFRPSRPRQRLRSPRFPTALLPKMLRTGRRFPGRGRSTSPPALWRPKSRPQTKPTAPPRNNFRPRLLPKKLKKSLGDLNVWRPFCDQDRWEWLSLPIEAVFGASAHPPKRPYGLTRPVVPPDGSFVFARISGTSALRNPPRPTDLRSARLRNPAMPLSRLTVDREENPGFLRISVGTGVQ
jgi:hypothetical protein